ncbi:MAG TPA: ABC transporter permease [Xanthobacteraceae bacterium]|jgi:NitT/TauT family transport system permease protein
MHARIHHLLWTAGSFAIVFAVWEAVVRLFAMPQYLLPGPGPVFVALARNFAVILSQTWWTAATVLAGFVIAAAVAVPLAMAIVISPTLERLVYPPMVATQSIPKIALAPLFIVWFGFGVVPKVAVAFLIAFFPIVIDTIVGLRSIDPAMLQLARSMGAPPHRTFLKMRLPHALPAIFGGLKVASSLAVVGALTGEFVGSDKGLGYMLVQASGNLNTALLFATLVVLSALAMAFFYLIEVLERIAIPWHASQRSYPP